MPKDHEIIIVEGSGQFPVDMLRYDSACPYSEEDTRSIMVSYDEIERYTKLRRVKLVSYAHKITPARWESFGWKVVSHEQE